MHSPQRYARALRKSRRVPVDYRARVVAAIESGGATITWTPGQPWEKLRPVSPEDFAR